MKRKPLYKELTQRLTDLEELLKALQNQEVDAIVGSRNVLMLQMKEAEERAREARNRYLDLYDYAPIGYITMKKDSSIVDANLNAANLLRLKKSELQNSQLNKIIAPDSQDAFYLHVKRLLETGSSDTCELLLKKKNGKQYCVQLTSVVINSGVKETIIRTALREITVRQKTAQELKKYRYKLEEMVKKRTAELQEQLRQSSEAEQKVRSLSQRLITVQEKEPLELVHVLHDKVGGTLTDLELALNHARFRHGDDAAQATDVIDQVVDKLTDQMHFISDCRELQEQLSQSSEAEQKVRSLSQRLIAAQEKERRELGHVLHDEVGSTLTILKLALKQARLRLSDDAAQTIDEIDHLVDEVINEIRFISHNMCPNILDNYGLMEALKWYLEQYNERTGIDIKFTGDKVNCRLVPQAETASYRIVQEAMNNVAKHSGAKSIEVSISFQDGILAISIKDDGCGFDPAQIISGTGITGMQDLAELVGGSLSVNSSLGEGTNINFELPTNMWNVKGKERDNKIGEVT